MLSCDSLVMDQQNTEHAVVTLKEQQSAGKTQMRSKKILFFLKIKAQIRLKNVKHIPRTEVDVRK